MIFKKTLLALMLSWCLFRLDGDGAAGGGDGKGGAAGADGKGGDGKSGGDPSLLAQGADAAAQAAAAAAAGKGEGKGALKEDPLAWIPERFRVFDGEGDAKKLNVEASAKKVAGSYGELEKRMKDTGLPPAAPTEYKFTPPKGMEKLELDGALTTEAQKGLHALGLTQKQYQGVMEMYVGSLNTMVDRGVELGAAKAAEELAKVWGPAEGEKFKGNLALANKAFMAFADEGDKAAIDAIGNNPVFLRVLAKIGRELREDTGVDNVLQSGESIDALMKDKAYWNAADPRHAEVKAKVMRHFEAQALVEARKAA